MTPDAIMQIGIIGVGGHEGKLEKVTEKSSKLIGPLIQ